MKRQGLVLLLLAAACGSVEEKAACATSADCPSGEWCAAAEGERRCWADSVPPVATDVTLGCATPCLRDGTLRVEATITDDHEVLSAEATLDLDPSRPVPLARSGARWVADVPLRDFPFERFEGPVTARVVGVDGAKTRSAAVQSATVQVTRLRWVYDAASPLTAPALMQDGTVVVGLSRTADQVVAVNGDGSRKWAVSAGTQFITAAPSVGERAIWVGSNDRSIYGVALDGSGILPNVGATATGPIVGSLAVRSFADREWAFATSTSGVLVGASTTANEDAAVGTGSSFAFGPILRHDGKLCAATSGATASLFCYVLDGAFIPDPAVPLDVNVSTHIAISHADDAWTGSTSGTLNLTQVAGPTSEVTTLSDSASDSPVLTSEGEAIAVDASGQVGRFRSDGFMVWSNKLNGDPLTSDSLSTPMLLTGGSTLIASRAGFFYVIAAIDGSVQWSASLNAGFDLRAPNIYTPPDQPAGRVLSTAYVSSASGKLYAVIVDGELDTSSPWPKAFHDPRNTNNAGTLP